VVLWLLAQGGSGAQAAGELDGAIHIGPGVKPPRALRKVKPEYSGDARIGRVQGTVVLQLAVTVQGRATGITVISPMGFGLDERAQAAVGKWRFEPGTKDGKPVKVITEVFVDFRLPDVPFNQKAERLRTDFNVALEDLKQTGRSAEAVARAVQSMQDLSRLGYPPAMHLAGLWEIRGDHVPKDPAAGLALIQQAAARNYGPALFEVAIRQIEGRDLPQDVGKGLETMRLASVLGSVQAQLHLGNRYEKGLDVPRELDRARRYFRLCGSRGVAACQYRLGCLLLDGAGRPEHELVQGVAWLQLAAGQGFPEAERLASRAAAGLTPEQAGWVATLKAQLVHR